MYIYMYTHMVYVCLYIYIYNMYVYLFRSCRFLPSTVGINLDLYLRCGSPVRFGQLDVP